MNGLLAGNDFGRLAVLVVRLVLVHDHVMNLRRTLPDHHRMIVDDETGSLGSPCLVLAVQTAVRPTCSYRHLARTIESFGRLDHDLCHDLFLVAEMP